ncbi:MAG: DNA internalization-related competence protein ComEC/Rec2 [Bacillota bacterium]|nr:DNA internalization-related competence protein ComEC/Rec2 [Bacillota bacterium]
MIKRPIVFFCVFLISGIITANLSHSYLISVVMAAAGLAVLLLLFGKIVPNFILSIGLVLFFLIGSFEYLSLDNSNSKRFEDFSQKIVTVKGVIESVPDIKETSVSYVLKTIELNSADKNQKISGKILLTVPLNNDIGLLGYGREITAAGQLNLPRGVRNPGGFDYRQYLAKSGISATMFAGNGCINVLGYNSTNPFIKFGLVIRNNIVTVINKCLPPEQAGLLNGMLIGYTDGLSDDVKKAFSDAGLSHIMAVSGMNITFIVAPLVFLFKKLRIRQRKANVLILIILAVFVSVTGFTPSVMRASIMAAVILIAQIIRREPDIYASISFAAILLLLFNPYTLFDIGFQLSFSATLSLVLFYRFIVNALNFKYLPEIIKDTAAATISAQIGILPLIALYFNKVSLVSVISNLLAVPLLGIITVLGFGMAISGQLFIPVARAVGLINCTLLSFVLYISRLSAKLPFAVIKVATPSALLITGYYVFILYIFWFRPKYSTSAKPAAMIAVFITAAIIFVPLISGHQMKVVFLDVGEGDSTFIRTSSGKTILIDGGGDASNMNKSPNIGDTVVVPFLYDQGITGIDLVIASHSHSDHIQGLFPVIENFHVKNLILPDNNDTKGFSLLEKEAQNEKVKVMLCSRGNIIQLDKYTYFEVLYPARGSCFDESSLNNSSIVLKLHYKDVSILFTGDIQTEAEEIILDSGTDLKADVLKVAHHGSSTSTGKDFINKVRPVMAVISVGKNNFGHPSQEVQARLEDNNIRIFRTDQSGAVILKSDGNTISVKRIVK